LSIFQKNPEDIAELLTRVGIEIKKIETRGANVENVLVSQITASSRHRMPIGSRFAK
jgi:hypothetical protein